MTTSRLAAATASVLSALACACVDADQPADPAQTALSSSAEDITGNSAGDGASGGTTIRTPIGLAIDIEDGTPAPLSVRQSQTFYINQIDMRAHANTTIDEGIAALYTAGDFASLDWRGTAQVDQSYVNLPNDDGTFTRRRFYRESAWMNVPTMFLIEQLDARGHVRGAPVTVSDGLLDYRTPGTFFARRLRGIQWVYDCVSKTDCSSATDYLEEALVELRYASGPRPTFQFDPATTQLRVTWTGNGHTYFIPVTQVARPTWDYGFELALDVTTPPQRDGTYKPGQTIDVQFKLTDSSGKDLAPGGQLPTFGDYLTGNDAPGIDYWDVLEPTMVYYRRKRWEKQMIVGIEGPVQSSATVRQTFDLVTAAATSPDGDVLPATVEQNGFYAAAFGVPNWKVLLGILPADTPVTNTGTFTLPPNAPPGTYKLVMKGRRSYMGEETASATTMTIQVGTTHVTEPVFETGNCTHCHNGDDALTHMSHGLKLADRDTCTICHVPLLFEPEGPLYVRSHFVHSRSGRLDASPTQCNLCHLTQQSIQQVSKSACMSCHTSYPDDHVAKYGPIVDMYIGGSLAAGSAAFGANGTIGEAFQQCTTSCHRDHPNSGL